MRDRSAVDRDSHIEHFRADLDICVCRYRAGRGSLGECVGMVLLRRDGTADGLLHAAIRIDGPRWLAAMIARELGVTEHRVREALQDAIGRTSSQEIWMSG